jgi:predicted dehydrogenase
LTRSVTLVGLGRIGMTNDADDADHTAVLTHAKAIAQSPDFRLEAAIDPDASARLEFTRRYSAPAFASLADLPLEYALDVVVVACPTSEHVSTVEALMSRGAPRAILIEKPVGGSRSDAELIAATCRSTGVQVFVNYHRSVLPSTAQVRELISTGAILDPYAGQALISGGRLTNGSHMVDLLMDWLGPVIATTPDPRDGGLWLDFAGCRVLLSEIAPGTFSIFEVTLLATNGRLRFDGWNDRWWWEGVESDPLTAGYDCLSEPGPVVPNGAATFMGTVYADLARALVGEPSNLRREDRALAVHDVLDGWV